MKNKQNLQTAETQSYLMQDVINSTLFRENLKEYLASKMTAGGLYGLTVRNDEFVDGLIQTIKLGIENKKLKRPGITKSIFY